MVGGGAEERIGEAGGGGMKDVRRLTGRSNDKVTSVGLGALDEGRGIEFTPPRTPEVSATAIRVP
jgi:hypothetical protein